MPYEWTDLKRAPEQSGAFLHGDDGPVFHLRLWANRSMNGPLFAIAMLVGLAGLSLPLLGLLGWVHFWIILLPGLAAIIGLWVALRAGARPGALEILTLTPARLTLSHISAKGAVPQVFTATPHWLRVDRLDDGPVAHYLVLRDRAPRSRGPEEPRIVSLGAFLSPKERVTLADELRARLAAVNAPQYPKSGSAMSDP